MHFARVIVPILALIGLFPVPTLPNADPPAAPDPVQVMKRHYRRLNLNGAFVLYDSNAERWSRYQPERCAERFLPASTFKIFNAMVGLETGVIEDETFVIRWDGRQRRVAGWNEDQDLATAISRSTVPYFQELARRVGEERMRHWITAEPFGNSDISGGIDQFWLSGGLRISPDEQVAFLRRLFAGTLKFSDRSMSIVRNIILIEETPAYRLRGKTGWGRQNDEQIGWIVGWVERDGNVFFFASLLTTPDPHFEMWNIRKQLTYGILEEIGIL